MANLDLEVRNLSQLSQHVASLPPLHPLLGSLISQGDVSILFARSGLGKTALAWQIAFGVASGARKILGDLGTAASPMKTAVFDFELNDRQFMTRYEGVPRPYFPAQVERVTVKWRGDETRDDIIAAIDQFVTQKGYRFIVIDNITWLSQELECARNAIALMRRLKELAAATGATFLVIAHTKKLGAADELDINALAGSANIGNLADSIFCIGSAARADDPRRYIKQIKTRTSAIEYGQSHVMEVSLGTGEHGLGMAFVRYAAEEEFLPLLNRNGQVDRRKTITRDKALALKSQGLSNKEIAAHLGVSPSAVSHSLND